MIKRGKKINLKNKSFLSIFFSIIILLTITGISIGYSAFASKLNISGVVTEVRVRKDIRVTGIELSSVTNSGSSLSADYNVNSIISRVTLPNSSSTVTYKVEITNIGNVELGIASLNGLPSNLTYEIKDSAGNNILKTKLCNSSGVCKNGISKDVYVTIKYATNGYNSSSTTYNLDLKFDFRKLYTVTYTGITNNNYPTTVMDGETLKVTFTGTIPAKVNAYINGTKVTSTTSSTITVENVNGDITLKGMKTVYLADLPQGTFFKESDYLTKIKTAQFVDYIDTTGALKTYDVTNTKYSPAGSIIAWIDSNYNLYIGSNDYITVWQISLFEAFYGMTGVTSVTFDNLETSTTTTLAYMFYNCSSLTSVDLSSFVVNNLSQTYSMFYGCSKLKNVNFGEFRTTQLYSFNQMFKGCSSLESVDLGNVSGINTPGTTYSSHDAFTDCTSLKSVNLGGFVQKSGLKFNMFQMFSNCKSLTYINMQNMDFSVVNGYYNMFKNVPNASQILVKNATQKSWITSKWSNLTNVTPVS